MSGCVPESGTQLTWPDLCPARGWAGGGASSRPAGARPGTRQGCCHPWAEGPLPPMPLPSTRPPACPPAASWLLSPPRPLPSFPQPGPGGWAHGRLGSCRGRGGGWTGQGEGPGSVAQMPGVPRGAGPCLCPVADGPPPAAPRKGEDAVPQAAERADRPGIPQTPPGEAPLRPPGPAPATPRAPPRPRRPTGVAEGSALAGEVGEHQER